MKIIYDYLLLALYFCLNGVAVGFRRSYCKSKIVNVLSEKLRGFTYLQSNGFYSRTASKIIWGKNLMSMVL